MATALTKQELVNREPTSLNLTTETGDQYFTDGAKGNKAKHLSLYSVESNEI